MKQIAVAIDGLAIAVNPNLNIPGLTVEQLQSIYKGKITNWNQVGGSDIPIKPYSRRVSDGGTVEIFVQDILGGQAFGNNVQFVSTTTQALEKVSLSLGGIYYASAPEVVPQCSIKPLPLGRTQKEYIAPYQEPFVSPNECPNKPNKLNIEAFQSGSYPMKEQSVCGSQTKWSNRAASRCCLRQVTANRAGTGTDYPGWVCQNSLFPCYW